MQFQIILKHWKLIIGMERLVEKIRKSINLIFERKFAYNLQFI